jgi:hypothetical protein
VVQQNYAGHWQGFHGRAANLAVRVAEHLLMDGPDSATVTAES